MRSPSRPLTGSETHARMRKGFPLLALLTSLAGCEIPTDLPGVESRWIVPGEQTRFGVASILPGDVSLTSDSSAFVVAFDAQSFSETLGGLCAACQTADGLTVPKPPFVAEFEQAIEFPSEVSSIEVVDGQVQVSITNGLNFDPIRPGGGAKGTLTLTITDDADGDVLGTLVIDGFATAFAPGAVLDRTVDLVPSSVQGSIVATVGIDSPAGDPVTIDADLGVSVTATPDGITVSAVEIDVSGLSVDLDDVSLGVEDVDADVVDRIIEGGFVLDVANPFGVAADFQLSLTGPTIAPIVKSVSIGHEPTSTVRVDFSGDELRSFMGHPDVMLSGAAVVDSGAGPVMVDPGEELVLSASLDLTLRIGG